MPTSSRRRAVFALLLILLAGLSMNCASLDRYIARHGAPDLMFEEAGDMGRYSRGTDHLEPLKCDRTTLYYVQDRKQVTFESGSMMVEPLTEEALCLVTQRLHEFPPHATTTDHGQ